MMKSKLLLEERKMEIGGWWYDYTSLKDWDWHEAYPWHLEKMAWDEKSDTACLIYAICEVRMGMEMGYLAILSDKSQPKLLFNLTSLLFPIQEPFYSQDGRYLLLKAQVYHKESHRIKSLILFLDVVERKFASLMMRGNNYSYQFEESSPKQFIIRVDEYQKQQGYDVDTSITLDDLLWHPFSDLENNVYQNKLRDKV